MSEVSGDVPTTPLKTQIRNARACEACRASKSRCFFRENQNLCQRCEQGGHPCVVRTKARPMRARAARPTQTITKNISPRPDGSEFSLELPSCSAPDGIKD
ncbi:hypothetical protein B0O99DRAFT_266488 [Bisporella sp. PMI_857]|nr:hypothetical protein B0O99DRAFT_266488 [Bisporella sp. PMI_857]